MNLIFLNPKHADYFWEAAEPFQGMAEFLDEYERPSSVKKIVKFINDEFKAYQLTLKIEERATFNRAKNVLVVIGRASIAKGAKANGTSVLYSFSYDGNDVGPVLLRGKEWAKWDRPMKATKRNVEKLVDDCISNGDFVGLPELEEVE